ncbi:MAG: metallophosphoesterase family protein [Kiritimatiellaeota bacterium]|nr:metallophosphoesterase family protein [Kiritimatiellota bacterium]
MRIAVVSDIHANLQAWNAVWLDIRSMAVDQVVSLGDAIGYGPNPAEVLEALYTSVDYFVLGNHDAAICGKIDPALFSNTARVLIGWTADHLGPRAIQELNTWPLTLAGPNFRCAHGEFGNPEYFHYVFDPAETEPSWQAVPEPLLFIGHTHQPCLYVIGASLTPHALSPQDFMLEPGKRYLVNTGSVGYSRDGDPRASYCIYDTVEGSVYWRRIPFDLDAYRVALNGAGLPIEATALLESDPRKDRPPLRELITFHPPDRPEQAVKNTIEVQHVDALRRRVRRWQLLAAGALTFLTALLATAGVLGWRYAHRELDIVGATLSARTPDSEPDNNLLVFPEAPVPAYQPVPGWHIHLGNRYRQMVAWDLADGRPGWNLQSSRANELWIASPLISVAPDMKFTLQGRVWKSSDFKGSLAVVVSLVRRIEIGPETSGRPEVIERFVVKEPTRVRTDGWSLIKQTFEIPARAEAISVQIRGRFQGAASLCDLSLERKNSNQ